MTDWRVYQLAELLAVLRRRNTVRTMDVLGLVDELEVRYRQLERELEEARQRVLQLERELADHVGVHGW